MKQLATLIFLLSLFQAQCQNSVDGKSNYNFFVESASIQRSYPGISYADHTWKEKWLIKLKGPANYSAKLNFLIDGYSIELFDLSPKGIVIGADDENYTIQFQLIYPLDKYYKSKRKTLTDKAQLEIIAEDFTEIIPIKNIETLVPISNP